MGEEGGVFNISMEGLTGLAFLGASIGVDPTGASPRRKTSPRPPLKIDDPNMAPVRLDKKYW